MSGDGAMGQDGDHTSQDVLPVLDFSAAVRGDGLSSTLAAHGFAVLRGLDARRLLECDASFLSLYQAPASVKAKLHCRPCRSTRATAHRLEHKRLPLAGIGFSVVSDGEQHTREQLHLVADASALALVPWPRQVGGLEAAARYATAELHSVAVRLLAALDAGYEASRAAQAERLGDPSVLDAFLYPAREAGQAQLLMRTHADPGLLTLTLASDPAGLEVRFPPELPLGSAQAPPELHRTSPDLPPYVPLGRCATGAAGSGWASRHGAGRAT